MATTFCKMGWKRSGQGNDTADGVLLDTNLQGASQLDSTEIGRPIALQITR
jgi:hypothetical protein